MKALMKAGVVAGMWLMVAGAASADPLETQGSEALAPAAGETAVGAESFGQGTTEAYDQGEIVCIAQNIRGARYYGSAWGYDAYNRACDQAMDNCYRDTILKRSCHVVYSGPRYNQPNQPNQPAGNSSGDGRFCGNDWDTSDATACGSPDGNGRQWYCSPKNNWCVLP